MNAIIFILLIKKKKINPIWLNVDKAIIFFISFSLIAFIPLINMDNKHKLTIKFKFVFVKKLLIKRKIINNPAVTRVELCTIAEIGVGAAIAIGNQDINGYCALFVIIEIKNIKVTVLNEFKLIVE